MPAYNEAATVGLAVKRVLDIRYPCDVEVVVVNDGSVDETSEVLAGIGDPRVTIAEHPVNCGKGAAVRTAAALATGDYLVIFDADLEYSPDDILGLLTPVSRGDAEVVYGIRKFGASTAHSFWFVIGNRVNTFTANALFNTWISDLHTCLKLQGAHRPPRQDAQSRGAALESSGLRTAPPAGSGRRGRHFVLTGLATRVVGLGGDVPRGLRGLRLVGPLLIGTRFPSGLVRGLVLLFVGWRLLADGFFVPHSCPSPGMSANGLDYCRQQRNGREKWSQARRRNVTQREGSTDLSPLAGPGPPGHPGPYRLVCDPPGSRTGATPR